jgi:hypothetical protein
MVAERRAGLRARGLLRAAAHDWDAVAMRHLDVYARMLEPRSTFVARGLVPRAYPLAPRMTEQQKVFPNA